MNAHDSLLAVRRLAIDVTRPAGWVPILHDVSFTIGPGEALGLMGRSGAGKTMTALALLGLLPPSLRIARGSIRWRGQDVASFGSREWQGVRGRDIAIIFQDPMTALHPLHRVERQVAEAITAHHPNVPVAQARDRAHDLLRRAGVPIAGSRRNTYPFQWSGGMRQRAVLAMAMANGPALLVADEPTTALDVTTQARVLDLLRKLRNDSGTALLFITHDPAIMREMVDRVAILRDGRVADIVPAADIVVRRPTASPMTTAASAEVLRVDRMTVRHPLDGQRTFGKSRTLTAVQDVSFRLEAGEFVGLVGESGCGKTSLARALLMLEPLAAGRVILDGADLGTLGRAALRSARAKLQIVFQDPYASLNPRRLVRDIIAEPLRVHGRFDGDGHARVDRLLDQVELTPDHGRRFPQQLSGGERQRVAIARAIALNPLVLILDEPVSSLDRPTQDAIVDLLRSLRQSLGMACLFIAHDLSLVKEIANRIMVMYLGRIVESGPADAIHNMPTHPYTQALLSAAPDAEPWLHSVRSRIVPTDEIPDAMHPPSGCRYHPRCPHVAPICRTDEPALMNRTGSGTLTACHFAEASLADLHAMDT